MKQFFKMIFASTLGFFVAMILAFTIFIFAAVGIVASAGSTPTFKPKENTVYKIKLSGMISDNPVENPFDALMGEQVTTLSLKDMLEAIKIAKGNDKISGIYIESGLFSSGTASLEALRRALIDFKESGKFIVSYADNFTQGSYFLCSVSDKVFLNPQGILEMNGISSQTMFYKGLMEKLGVKMEIFKVGTYKGAVEPFMLDHLSDANREQIQSFISSIWGNISEGIASSRKISADKVNEYANKGLTFSDAKTTIEYGFVDELKYKPDAEAYVKELAKQETDKKMIVASTAQIKTLQKPMKDSDNQIAVLYAEGEIKDEIPGMMPSMEQTITGKLADELIKLKNDDKVKAVVFRVNSPGGSAYLSEQIWRQVVKLKKVKPIVVSMGNFAASGGYYISCAANKIIAEKNTLTGSIGIFGMFPNVTGLVNKLALTTDVVKTNTYSDMGDLTRPMTEGEKALIQAHVERGYQTFLTRCADGRGMTTDEINTIGQGRVWTGEQAKERGLVDELGGIELAISSAAELAKLDKYEVKAVSNKKDFFEEIFSSKLEEMKISIVKNVLGSEYEYYQKINNVKTNYGIQARIPYDMKPL